MTLRLAAARGTEQHDLGVYGVSFREDTLELSAPRGAALSAPQPLGAAHHVSGGLVQRRALRGRAASPLLGRFHTLAFLRRLPPRRGLPGVELALVTHQVSPRHVLRSLAPAPGAHGTVGSGFQPRECFLVHAVRRLHRLVRGTAWGGDGG